VVFKPEPGPVAFLEACPLPCDRDVLTWEPAGNKVNCFQGVTSDFSHIFIPFHFRPVFFKDLSTERVYLYLPLTGHPCSFKAEVYAADT
jgi:hypothetical protein